MTWVLSSHWEPTRPFPGIEDKQTPIQTTLKAALCPHIPHGHGHHNPFLTPSLPSPSQPPSPPTQLNHRSNSGSTRPANSGSGPWHAWGFRCQRPLSGWDSEWVWWEGVGQRQHRAQNPHPQFVCSLSVTVRLQPRLSPPASYGGGRCQGAPQKGQFNSSHTSPFCMRCPYGVRWNYPFSLCLFFFYHNS